MVTFEQITRHFFHKEFDCLSSELNDDPCADQWGEHSWTVPLLKAPSSRGPGTSQRRLRRIAKRCPGRFKPEVIISDSSYEEDIRLRDTKPTTYEEYSRQRGSDPDTTTVVLPAASKTGPKTQPCRLLSLPTEIILQIMYHMSAIDLFSFRQTSRRFLELFSWPEFRMYHAGAAEHGYPKFDVGVLYHSARFGFTELLHHEEYCSACLEFEETGLLRDRLSQLMHQKRHCSACVAEHKLVFFYPEDVKRHDERGERLACIGQKGHVTICKHTRHEGVSELFLDPRPKDINGAIMWRDVQRLRLSGPGVDTGQLMCTHRSHEPGNKKKTNVARGLTGAPNPRFITCLCRDDCWPTFAGIGWDLPLFDISRTSVPSLAAIRNMALKRLLSALPGQIMCPHFSLDNHLPRFVQSGICACFRDPKAQVAETSVEGCKCGRREYYQCVTCDAEYFWRLAEGRVYFSYRNCWRLEDPTSPQWLSFLDQEELRDELFTEDTEHVYWCRNEHCRCNRAHLWEAMVRWNSGDEYWRDDPFWSIYETIDLSSANPDVN